MSNIEIKVSPDLKNIKFKVKEPEIKKDEMEKVEFRSMVVPEKRL